MTDLEKAKHAAEEFANYEFQGITMWMVEETRTNYQVFGHTESPIELERLSYKSKQKHIVNVVGGIGTRYTAFGCLFDGAFVREGRLNNINYPALQGTGYSQQFNKKVI